MTIFVNALDAMWATEGGRTTFCAQATYALEEAPRNGQVHRATLMMVDVVVDSPGQVLVMSLPNKDHMALATDLTSLGDATAIETALTHVAGGLGYALPPAGNAEPAVVAALAPSFIDLTADLTFGDEAAGGERVTGPGPSVRRVVALADRYQRAGGEYGFCALRFPRSGRYAVGWTWYGERAWVSSSWAADVPGPCLCLAFDTPSLSWSAPGTGAPTSQRRIKGSESLGNVRSMVVVNAHNGFDMLPLPTPGVELTGVLLEGDERRNDDLVGEVPPPKAADTATGSNCRLM